MRALLVSAVVLSACAGVYACGGSTTVGTGDGGADASVGNDGSGGADGAATADGGGDEGGTDVDGAAACPAYDDTNKACITAADCTTVARGCYCGGQPVIGISKSIGAIAAACEAEAGAHCGLGCANFPGQVAEDGKNNVDGGTIAVLCDNMKCHTVLQ